MRFEEYPLLDIQGTLRLLQSPPPELVPACMGMSCIVPVAHDMYAGLCRRPCSVTEEAFFCGVRRYHAQKHGLNYSDGSSPDVDDDTFFLLKKSTFHWVEGIKLALRCGGMTPDAAERLAAVGCDTCLRGSIAAFDEVWEQVRGYYDRVVSSEIQKQYASGRIPTDEWCAWLELEAAKTVLFAEEVQTERTRL